MQGTRSALAVVVLLLSHLPARCTDKKPLTFERVAMGEIEENDAMDAGFRTQWCSCSAHFGFTVFKASNGTTLAVYYDDFKTPEEAKHFLDWKAKRSFKLVSQSTKTDSNGQPTEYRLEFVPESNHSKVDVMWVVGKAVHWIDGRTVEDALELERQYSQ